LIEYEGPLPLNEVHSFGLPGYINSQVVPDIAEDCTVRVVTTLGYKPRTSTQNMLFASGLTFSTIVPHVAARCQSNSLMAVCARQLMVVPEVDLKYGGVFAGYARKHLDMIETLFHFKLRFVEEQVFAVSTFDEWVARYGGAARKVLEEARANIKVGIMPTDYELFKIVAFMKVEKIFKDEEYPPRNISGPSAAYKVTFGPFIYSLTRLYKALMDGTQTSSHRYFASGASSEDLGRWFDGALSAPDAIAVMGDDQLLTMLLDSVLYFIEVDGKRHDAHMHGGFREHKFEVYEMLLSMLLKFGGPVDSIEVHPGYNNLGALLARLKSGQKSTQGKTNDEIRYSHVNRVCSGWADTSFGNSVSTDLCGYAVKESAIEYYNLVGTMDGAGEYISKTLRDMGYEIKIKISTDPADVTFLSGLFVPVDGQTWWIPKPGRLIAGIGWTTTRPTKKTKWRHLAATINGFGMYRFVPFLRVYCGKVMSLIPEEYRCVTIDDLHPDEMKGLKHTVQTQMGGAHRRLKFPLLPSASTWEFFDARYHLSQEDEKRFTICLDKADCLPFMVDSYAMKILASVDL
jgi:hypothetical protein